MEHNSNTVWTTGYMRNGLKASFTFVISDPMNAFTEAAAYLDKLLADGFTQNEPGLEAGEESELIITVMRREKSDGTPIIDFYPAWGAGSDEPYGTYKYIHKYMNNADEINDFLKVSGFKSLDAIPLYDGQSPLKRTVNKAHAKETAVPTPFKVVRKQGKEKTGSDGNPYRPWELVRYEAAGNAPQSHEKALSSGSTGKQVEWNTDAVKRLSAEFGLDAHQLKSALRINGAWSEWTGGYAAARDAVEAYKKTLELDFMAS
jgi:hypothetical protein